MNSTPFNQARYAPLMTLTDPAAADAAFNTLVEQTMREAQLDPADPVHRPAAEALERNNLAVYAALNEPRAFAQVERLFKLDHKYYRTEPPKGGDPGTPPSGGSAPAAPKEAA
jgi:hypothetical protein